MLKMGQKVATPGVFLKENDSPAINVDLPSRPYRFLSTNDMRMSASSPTAVKLILKRNYSRANRSDYQTNAGSTSLVFLSNERYLVFGSICTELDTYAIERRLYNQGLSEHDNLSLVDLQSGETRVLINHPVRDISLTSSGEHLAFLTYSGYSHLQVCPSGEVPEMEAVEIFEEKSLISHSTCCSFSPDGKWLVVGVCSDYFTMRSRSHLVVRSVNPRLQKIGKSKVIDFADHLLPKHLPAGLLIGLEFSTDCSLLALSGSKNSLFLLSTKTWTLLSTVGEPRDRFTSLWGIFHPLQHHEMLLSCTGFGKLEKWNVKADGEVMPEDGNKSTSTLNIVDDFNITVSCPPKFAPNGSMLAVGLSNGKVVIVEPDILQELWVIDPGFIHAMLHHIPTINASSLCFSKSCEYMAVGYSGDYVVVWLLPRNNFTLKHFCRTVIISKCPPKLIQKLPISKSLKKYLLYQP